MTENSQKLMLMLLHRERSASLHLGSPSGSHDIQEIVFQDGKPKRRPTEGIQLFQVILKSYGLVSPHIQEHLCFYNALKKDTKTRLPFRVQFIWHLIRCTSTPEEHEKPSDKKAVHDIENKSPEI